MRKVERINPYEGVMETRWTGDHSRFWAVSSIYGFLLTHGKLAEVLADPELPESLIDKAVEVSMRKHGHPLLYKHRAQVGMSLVGRASIPIMQYVGYSIFEFIPNDKGWAGCA